MGPMDMLTDKTFMFNNFTLSNRKKIHLLEDSNLLSTDKIYMKSLIL